MYNYVTWLWRMRKDVKLVLRMWKDVKLIFKDEEGCRRMWSDFEGCEGMMKDEERCEGCAVFFKDDEGCGRMWSDFEGCAGMQKDVKWFWRMWRDDEGWRGMRLLRVVESYQRIWRNYSSVFAPIYSIHYLPCLSSLNWHNFLQRVRFVELIPASNVSYTWN
jgi:hypothetical protein